MREPPPDLDDQAVLAAVRDHWACDADHIEHLPVGFGAYHWVVGSAARRTHFVTLDAVGGGHSAGSLDAAYAAAATLATDLDFVLAPVATTTGTYTAAFGAGALSLTPWVEGTTPQLLDLDRTASALARLHAAEPPTGLPSWQTLVPPSLADDLADLARDTWDSGPYGERARIALRGRLDAVADWADAYHALGELAQRRHWVVTHGEPHERNLLVADPPGSSTTYIVDWETVRLAPPERDWRALLERGWSPTLPLDAAMLDLFDLEWRLDEISQYAAWFAAPHTGTESDRVAIAGLLHELTRAPFETSAKARHDSVD